MLPWDLIIFYFLVLIGTVSGSYYCFTQYSNYMAWNEIPEIHYNEVTSQTMFSVIVAGRNEAENIVHCLTSILNQDFAKNKFEIIFVDDHSEDQSLSLVQNEFDSDVKTICLSEFQVGFGKKNALQAAINQAKGDWIVTTDADCIVPINWLAGIQSMINESQQLKIITGPVAFKTQSSYLEIFQQLDIIGMMGVTAGGIARKVAYLANGANLAYQRAAFLEVNGFQGIDEKASGDDMLLLHKIVQAYPNSAGFAKSSQQVVLTNTEVTLNNFFKQRLRWASKGSDFQSNSTWLQMVMVFLFSFSIVACLLLSIVKASSFLLLFCLFYIIKFNVDYIYQSKFSRYFGKEKLIKHITWASLAHAFYITIVGIWAQFYKTYDWKGRATK